MGIFLFTGQVILFLILFFLSNLLVLFTSIPLVLIFLGGLAVGVLGLLSIGRASYSPLPKPTKGNTLSRRGIYKYIRHPMYTGLLLVGLAFVLSRPTVLVLLLYAAFVLVSNLKADLEERLLERLHPAYAAYSMEVSKFIPFFLSGKGRSRSSDRSQDKRRV